MSDLIEKTKAILAAPHVWKPSPRVAGKALALHRKRVGIAPDIVAKNLGITERELGLLEEGLYTPTQEQIGILSTMYGLNEKKIQRNYGYDGG